MITTFKEMYFPVFAVSDKDTVKPAAKDERSALIDRMVASLGLDYEARSRYFTLTRTV